MKINSYWTQSPAFNGNTPNQHSLLSQTSSYHLKLWLHGRQAAQHISWSQGYFMSPHISESILWTFTPSVNCTWYLRKIGDIWDLSLIENYFFINTSTSMQTRPYPWLKAWKYLATHQEVLFYLKNAFYIEHVSFLLCYMAFHYGFTTKSL